MNALIFTTYDITPERWENFAKAAQIPPDATGGDPIVPYVLVHSRSQQDLQSETEEISTTIKTEFSSATWDGIRDTFIAIAEPNSQTIHTQFFLIVDEQSTKDRRVIIMHRSRLRVTPKGDEWRGIFPNERDDLRKITVWKRHRVPFEKAFETTALMDVHGGLETEPYLEEVKKEPGWRISDRTQGKDVATS
ncbi:hypothetical protein K469DRAFT_657226 [Zopfia rhizophila CBS 207.26]|uniref:Uncharacterized protein n=1 Tax=Zopfia rhizophila CBS 207.26 TaxID=1314779 RepID=A0A6A6EKS7_9PEZI|nr:hypothetical protein K469DRAFT_657226 [Zopfia rhizophila CBS 207.26]